MGGSILIYEYGLVQYKPQLLVSPSAPRISHTYKHSVAMLHSTRKCILNDGIPVQTLLLFFHIYLALFSHLLIFAEIYDCYKVRMSEC